MSYRAYFERHKDLDAECTAAQERFMEAHHEWGVAFSERRTAQKRLDYADEEAKPERARELEAAYGRMSKADEEVAASGELRERKWGERAALEKEFLAFDAAESKGIDPADKDAPPDIPSFRERAGKYVEQAIEGAHATVHAAAIFTKLYTGTPEIEHEQQASSPTMEQIQQAADASSPFTSPDPDTRVRATPAERQPEITNEKEEKKSEQEDLDEETEGLAHENKMSSVEDLKAKNEKSLDETSKSNRHASIPDPEKSAEMIAKQEQTVANDNEPQHHAIPAADKPVAIPAHAAGGGMPNPDPPATVLAAKTPANDNHPKSPANDNDPSL